MDHQIARINQHPIARGLDGIAPEMQPGLAKRLIQMRCHGLQLALHLAGRDNQPIRVIGAACHIQDDDVFGLVVFQAFARGIHKQFQPIWCYFRAALGARGARCCRCFGNSGLRLRRRLTGLGRGLRGGCFRSSALRGWLGSLGFRRGLRLGRRRFWLGAGLGLGRGFGFWLGGDAPLWAFFSRGGLAGYGRLLLLDTSRVQPCRPDRGGGGSVFPRGDETPSGRCRSPLGAGKQRAGPATLAA